MRIAIVSHAYPRWDGDLAGAFVARLARALADRGHTVSALVPADRGCGGPVDEAGVRIVRVRYAPAALERLAHRGTMLRETATPWGAAAFLTLLSRLARAITAGGYDAVHAHWWVPAGVAASRAAGQGSPPPVVTLHGTDVRLLWRLPGATALARRSLGRAAHLTAVSRTLATRAALRLGRPPESVTVIPMPAALEYLPSVPAPDRRGVVVVSRLTRQKRVHLLLHAMALLAQRGLPLPLTIVGDGPERSRLEALSRRLGLEHLIVFTGAVAPSEVASCLGGAAVAAFPAREEGFGLAAAEALMCGVPVVAAQDGGGLLDIVPTRGAGRIVPAARAATWAEAIAELAKSQPAREQAWAEGQAWRERLSPDAVAARFEALYARA